MFRTGTDKGIMFFSAPKSRYLEYFEKHGINCLLMSYHYVKSKPGEFEKVLEYLERTKGYLMIDSGAFTFKNSGEDKWFYEESYKEYLEEFVAFCYKYKKWIYCTVNMDMEKWVGFDIVDKWNDELFRPLAKEMNVIFNIDAGTNPTIQMERLKLYAEEFGYFGITRLMLPRIAQVYAYAQMYNARVHGFAVTSLSVLKSTPLFSVDSTSWLTGTIYGSTYKYDGKNFYNLDKFNKWKRRSTKLICRDHGIDYEKFILDQDVQVTEFNLMSWTGFEKEFLQIANTKLRTQKVSYYDKRGTHT